VPRTPKTRPTSRLTLDLAEPVRKELDALKDVTQADSLVEVIRRSLAVYKFLWEEKKGGRKLVTRGEGGDREVVLL
jgi:hypothetical protein